jgi:hypothetical protein
MRKAFILPAWNRYINHSNDLWDSLAIFLGSYAFERQGRSPNFSDVAISVLLGRKNMNAGNVSAGLAEQIWSTFKAVLSPIGGINAQNNPLYPSTDPDGLGLHGKQSIFEKVLTITAFHPGLSLSTYLANEIKASNDTVTSFAFLSEVRGIGDKIAPFYLRDLVDVLNLSSSITKNRDLLQPIDTWVRRTVRVLSKDPTLSDERIRKWIVEESLRIGSNPERVNMGMWLFGSQMTGSKFSLYLALLFGDGQYYFEEYKNEIKAMHQSFVETDTANSV